MIQVVRIILIIFAVGSFAVATYCAGFSYRQLFKGFSKSPKLCSFLLVFISVVYGRMFYVLIGMFIRLIKEGL